MMNSTRTCGGSKPPPAITSRASTHSFMPNTVARSFWHKPRHCSASAGVRARAITNWAASKLIWRSRSLVSWYLELILPYLRRAPIASFARHKKNPPCHGGRTSPGLQATGVSPTNLVITSSQSRGCGRIHPPLLRDVPTLQWDRKQLGR